MNALALGSEKKKAEPLFTRSMAFSRVFASIPAPALAGCALSATFSVAVAAGAAVVVAAAAFD